MSNRLSIDVLDAVICSFLIGSAVVIAFGFLPGNAALHLLLAGAYYRIGRLTRRIERQEKP
jgi:hypothetical protein